PASLREPPSRAAAHYGEVKGVGDVILMGGQDRSIILVIVDLPDRQEKGAATNAQSSSDRPAGPHRPTARDAMIPPAIHLLSPLTARPRSRRSGARAESASGGARPHRSPSPRSGAGGPRFPANEALPAGWPARRPAG